MIPIMRRLLLLIAVPALAADLPPDKGNTIPESGKRPVVVTADIRHSSFPSTISPTATHSNSPPLHRSSPTPSWAASMIAAASSLAMPSA